MKTRSFPFVIITALAFLTSCNIAKQTTTGCAFIVEKCWRLIELNGQTVQSTELSGKEPHMILNASEKRVTGNGGCNSFFGSYELQSDNGITFSKIGATKMACRDGAMQVESQLFQALEKTNKFTLKDDSLFLSTTGRPVVAKFAVSNKN